MGGQTCSNCKKGVLIRTSKGTKRCTNCGYIKHDSPGRRSQGTILGFKKEKENKGIPKIESEIEKVPKGEGYYTEDYQNRKWVHDARIRLMNKQRSIEKELKRLRKKKYNRPETFTIEGEVYNVETGKVLAAEEMGMEKKDFIPEEMIEEMPIFEKAKKEKKGS